MKIFKKPEQKNCTFGAKILFGNSQENGCFFGGVFLYNAIIRERFDYIFYTGSTNVGKIIGQVKIDADK